jgi:photosystem II stability/assembly factor-like uncharacterized protein
MTDRNGVTLFVGTRRGLFRVQTDPAHTEWDIGAPQIEGHEIAQVCAHPTQPGRLYAAANHRVWGGHVYTSDDAGASWEPLGSAPHHAPGQYKQSVKGIWCLAMTPDGQRLYAGIDPAGLFVSDDEGESWEPVEALNQHSTNRFWEATKGFFAMHSVCFDPANPQNMFAAVSAGGAYRSTDGGVSWHAANQGVRAENIPRENPEAGHNVHRLILHPGGRLYRQCYSGIYRSDDGARSWLEITGNVPSDYGFAIATNAANADVVFCIPMSNSHMRATVDGRLRVYRSDDGGASWADRSAGLPQQHAYVGVLREAMDTLPGRSCGVYFGTNGGHLFASRDAGENWQMAAGFLPPVSSVLALTS